MSVGLITLRRIHGCESFVGVSIRSSSPNGADDPNDFCVRGAASQQRLEIMAMIREKASHQFPISRQSRPRTTGAKRLGDRGNHPESAAAISELVIDRRRAPLVSPDLSNGEVGVDLLQNLLLRDHLF